MTEFKDFNLDEKVLEALAKKGFTAPTPIQAKVIPIVLAGKDVMGLAETGSGKTAASAIPLVNGVDVDNPHIQVLILVPTRELALQYATETQEIGKRKGTHTLAVFGGEDAGTQLAKLRHKVQICVATPGRLIDFIYSREIDLTHVKTLVLDEADEMLSMGFYDDLDFICQCMVQEHQTLLFSATMPKDIRKLAERYLNDPVEVKLNASQVAPKNIDHSFVFCKHHERGQKLMELIKEKNPGQSIIFTESRRDVEELQRELQKGLSKVDFLHGGLSQQVRTVITGKFRSGKIQHLVATDVASRGLDFSGVTHVFMHQLPRDPEVYVHRAGRTGRTGREGTVISLVTPRELGSLKRIGQLIKQEPKWLGDKPSNSGSAPKKRSFRPRKKTSS